MTAANNPSIGLEFQTTDTKLYVSIVTLLKENDKKLLKQLKPWFKRSVKWNKYRSQITNQSNNNSWNYLIDPTFSKVSRLSVLSFMEKMIQRKIILRFIFTLLFNKSQNKRFQIFDWWKKFLWLASKNRRRSLRENHWDE